jgi:cold-inducible RNA-binding protein
VRPMRFLHLGMKSNMPVRLFVGNLPYDVTEPELKGFFAPVGPLSSVIIPVDRETGKRRGFAFVEFGDAAQAAEAIRRFNNQPFKERPIVINEARARESRPDSASGGRSGFPMRSAPGGAARPFSPRPAFDRPDFGSQPIEDGLGGRAQRRNRNFGPDAKPIRKRKPFRSPGGEMGGKKRPIRERVGGQFFGSHEDDDLQDDKELELWPDIDRPVEEEED